MGIRFNAGAGWIVRVNRNHRAPFGETRSEIPILDKPVAKTIKPLRDLFAGEVGEGNSSFVHLDAGNDALLRESFRYGDAVRRPLANRFVEQNHAADEFAQSWSRELHLAIDAAVFLSGRNVERLESLFDGRKTFIRRQDAFAGSEERFNR